MAKSSKETAVARQVELVIRRLNSLCTLPEVAAGFLAKLAAGTTEAGALAEIIESDPALTAKILSLAYNEGVTFGDGNRSVAEVVAKMPASMVRDAVLSVKVFAVFDADYDPDKARVLPRKQLALHALATACCAKSIAEYVLDNRDKELAFSAGLLHDIGKSAIDEVMPKSFERIVEEARANKTSMPDIEQKHLGLDHTTIGKRLGEKWHLPEEIVFAIWLHHSDTEVICENMSAGRVAGVVRLADIIARQCGIGMSGSFDSAGSISGILESLSLSTEQVEQIRSGLAQQVADKSRLLGLEIPGGPAAYSELICETAAKLSRDYTQLTLEKRQLAARVAHLDFIMEFSRGVGAECSAIDVAAAFGTCWQRHYQTGPVCVYLLDDSDETFAEMVTVDNSGRTNTGLLEVPADTHGIPAKVQNKFAILDAADWADWLFEQVELDFDVSRTKLIPLLAAGRAVGAIVFEHRLPVDPAQQLSLFEVSTSIAAGLIALAQVSAHHSSLAEQFAQVLGRLRLRRDELVSAKSLAGIAEMAAGAAHELNNPLAVISGRAQLLYDSEDDDDKKQMLKQIQTRTDEISRIISELMSFARPEKPVLKVISPRQLLDGAIDQASQGHKLKQIEAEFNEIDELGDVYVDDGQVTTAIANIVSNALESYSSGSGPIRIDGGCEQPVGFVSFEIIDNGCGMDSETLAKATGPFFSAKGAGRQRGMGLAHAQRLLQLNNGTMHITSQPDHGTTVTVCLPQTK